MCVQNYAGRTIKSDSCWKCFSSWHVICLRWAPSTLEALSKQHSTLWPKTATLSNEFIIKLRTFDKVECCFDNVVDNVAKISNETSSLRQTQNKLNMFSLFCRKNVFLIRGCTPTILLNSGITGPCLPNLHTI